jgi:phosphoglycerate dehydrogenase-like enzyme
MKIAVTSPSFSKNKKLQNQIYKYFPNSKLNLDGKRFNENQLIEYIKEADGIIVGLDEINSKVLNSCQNLKIIAKYGVGLNNIDLETCKKKNIFIGWTGGVNKLSVAEMTIGFMLMLARNLFMSSNELKNGIWNKSAGFQLSGKTVGIIGLGNTGKELVRLLNPFNCSIYVNDIIKQSEYCEKNNLEEVSKEYIFNYCDFVTINTQFNDTTKNMIDLNILKTMKSSAYLINIARGGIINELDLKYALKNKIIAGAAIDTYLEEPPNDLEFLKLPNLICTPHIGGNAKEAVEAMGMSAIEHLKKYYNL